MAEEKKYKIVHDIETCIGCSACASVCPKYWEMNSNGKADLIGGEKTGSVDETQLELEDSFDDNMESAEVCPVNCIHIYDDKDEKLI